MVFLDFLDFLEFLETSEVAGPGPNPREIDISFGAQWPLACARPDPTIGWTDVLPCVFVCVWGRYPPAAALLVRRQVVPVLNTTSASSTSIKGHKKRTEYTFSMKCPRDRPRKHGARIGPVERI